MAPPPPPPWRPGGYAGDVSALALVPAPPSALWVLAGVGGEVRVRNALRAEEGSAARGAPAAALRGVRIYGIVAAPSEGGGQQRKVAVALHGGRVVRCGALDAATGALALRPGAAARGGEWVMAVAHVGAPCVEDGAPTRLAVGLSDNSVELWDCARRQGGGGGALLRRLECAERRLLYCMAFDAPRAASLEALRVASGTVWDEVVLWAPREGALAPRARLRGHGGSITRVAWAEQGAAVLSVSDDRTARVWDAAAWRGDECEEVEATRVLYGHGARVWDCALAGGALLTAAEDRSVRAWDVAAGRQAATLRGHGGRGVWRLAAERVGDRWVVASGGADGTIKLWALEEHIGAGLLAAPNLALCGGHGGDAPAPMDTSAEGAQPAAQQDVVAGAGFDAIALRIPNSSEANHLRAVALAGSGDLAFVATNGGHVHALQLGPARSGDRGESVDEVDGACWTRLYTNAGDDDDTSAAAAVVSIAVRESGGGGYHVAFGDVRGRAGVLCVTSAMQVAEAVRWEAHAGKMVVAVHWPSSSGSALGGESLLTAEGIGVSKVWDLESRGEAPATLRCALAAPSSVRTHCVDVVADELVCGDQRGNVFLFALPPRGAPDDVGAAPRAPRAALAHAHGRDSVSLVRLLVGGALLTSGRDGLTHWHERLAPVDGGDGGPGFVVVRSRRLEALSSLQGLVRVGGACGDLLAWGFYGDELIVTCLESSREICRVTCGGWRRPYAVIARWESGGRIGLTLAFLRGQRLHVHRSRPAASDGDGDDAKLQARSLYPRVHGLEAHSALMLEAPPASCASGDGAWLLTGGEDGEVRASLLGGARPALCVSLPLGAHPGGATVRAVAAGPLRPCERNDGGVLCALYRQLAFSAGSRYTLLAWEFAWRPAGSAPAPWAHGDEPFDVRQLGSCPHHVAAGVAPPSPGSGGKRKRPPMDDHRFKSVAVLCAEGAALADDIACVATGTADAALSLLAFAPRSRRWASVAALRHHQCPVLALAALPAPAAGWLASGGTDGVVALWDLRAQVADAATRCATERWSPPSVNVPALLIPASHQSGVNCLTAMAAPGGVVVVSGGDDQSLHVTTLRVTDHETGSLAVGGTRRVESAHTSQVLGVCPVGTRCVLSAGLDQRFAVWRIEDSGDSDGSDSGSGSALSLARVQTALTEVVDVDDVAAAPLPGGGWVAAVVGRGVQCLARAAGDESG